MYYLAITLIVIVCILYILGSLTEGLEGLTKMLEEYGRKKDEKESTKAQTDG